MCWEHLKTQTADQWWKTPHRTEQVGRDGTFEVDVFWAVLVVKLPPHKGMQVLIEWLYGFVELLEILLKGVTLIPRAPVVSSVCETWTGQKHSLLFSILLANSPVWLPAVLICGCWRWGSHHRFYKLCYWAPQSSCSAPSEDHRIHCASPPRRTTASCSS